MTAFCAVATPEKINTKNDNQAAAFIAGAGILGTAVYWATRESNDSVTARARALLAQNNVLIQEADTYLSQESNFLTSDLVAVQNSVDTLRVKLSLSYDQLLSVYSAIKARYDSSLTPWNWSDAMLQMCKELKPVIEYNEIKLQEIKLLLSKITYVCNLALYQKALQSTTIFIADNKYFLQQRVFACETIHGLQQILIQKRLIQKDLQQFFADYKNLNIELDKRGSCLNLSDRNKPVEREFRILYEQALFLHQILKYSDCIVHLNNESMLIREARKVVGASSYPIKDFVSVLGSDISGLLAASLVAHEPYAQFCLEILQDLKATVIASNEYIAERRAYELYLEQKRQAQAAEKAACAAQEAADAAQRQARAAKEAAEAAQRQARAAEEQNRLKKEENRINQERNNAERNKQQNNKNNNDRW